MILDLRRKIKMSSGEKKKNKKTGIFCISSVFTDKLWSLIAVDGRCWIKGIWKSEEDPEMRRHV